MTNRVEGADDDTPTRPNPVVPGAVDARFTLAAERTVLAWLRTALGLIAAGVAVLHLLGGFTRPAAQNGLGITLIALGALTAVLGVHRWRAVERALQRGGPLPGPWPVLVLCALLVVAGLGFVLWR
ncbi:MAG: DUF202 domain-containing protein [Gordonia sp. (in: high G+C Gram-positive bacteria)]|uniref:YidH family protein n=1 Tax=Gordonia sp. (in: high G+C Gram-positive bacteria) TaxID=84139 RepID=UPI0039E3872A